MKQKNNLATRKMMLATLGALALAALVGLSLSLQPTNKTFAQEKDAPKIQANAPNNPTSPTVCVQSPSGLVSWYRAEGNANDARGSNNGTLQNGATFATGNVGQAFSFDGNNDLLRIPHSATLNPINSFSIEAWIYPTGFPSDQGSTIMAKWGAINGVWVNQRAYNFGIGQNGKLQFSISDDVNQGNNSFHVFLTDAPVLSLNSWNHVVAVYDQSTGQRRLYTNGILVATRTDAPITITNSISDAAIGGKMNSPTFSDDYFSGLIDEVSFYNRALSAAEIQAIFNAGSDGKCLASVRKQFDFDGDGRADQVVFRPSNGVWYLLNSQLGFTATQFGISTDRLAPADFDGDGRTDIAVYRDGIWYLLRSTAGFTTLQFGIAEDIPQPADFDGDGRAELAVYRPSNGTWYVFNLLNNQFAAVQFGNLTDKPLVGDYDGDNRADYAVQRTTGEDAGTWFILQSSNNQTDAVPFGLPTDKAVPADYDGDGKTDIAVFRRGTWYLLGSTTNRSRVAFGLPDDVPTPADYDGDGRADIGVYRPSNGTWYRQNSTNGQNTSVQFGISEDRAIPNAFVR